MKLNSRQELALWGLWIAGTLLLWQSNPGWFFWYDARYTLLPLFSYPLLALVPLVIISLRTRN